MGRLSVESLQRAIALWNDGVNVSDIRSRFKEEGKDVSLVALCKLIKKYEGT